jgi:hypothetical protein
MRLTKKQELAAKNGQPVHLRKEGVEYVVMRADLYDRVATLFEIDNPLVQTRRPGPDVGGAVRDKPNGPAGDPCEPWTEEKNGRRCELIDKDIEGTISESEKLELERLQERFYQYLDTVAPPPMEGARRLHRQLLAKKRRRELGG